MCIRDRDSADGEEMIALYEEKISAEKSVFLLFSAYTSSSLFWRTIRSTDVYKRQVYVLLREDIQDEIQQDPCNHQREQIPHGAAGEEQLAEIGGRVGQTQCKAAQHLVGLVGGIVQAAEQAVMDDKMEHGGGNACIDVRLEQRFELLVAEMCIRDRHRGP